jgi:hypothetical protein
MAKLFVVPAILLAADIQAAIEDGEPMDDIRYHQLAAIDLREYVEAAPSARASRFAALTAQPSGAEAQGTQQARFLLLGLSQCLLTN